MSDRIYTRADGKMEELREQSFGNDPEGVLQELIAQHPDLLSGEQLSPENPLRWILITREQGIAEEAGAGNRWSVDHLLIDQDARPTLVEVKLSRNPEIRRAVVGQLLEYAAHARRSWDADDLRRTFEAQPDWEDTLRALLEGDDEPDPDEFWRSVKTNLRASNLRLLFVADTIPGPLAQVVEFLNEQMRDVDVLAVEIKRYVGGGRETFVPRVIGRSVKPRAAGTSLTLDGIVARFPEEPVREAAQHLIDRARAAGATFEPGSRGFSIRGACELWPQPVTVAWVYPAETGWARTRHFSFGAGIFSGYDPPAPAALSELLRRYAGQFASDPYAQDVSSTGVVAWCVEPDDAAKHIGVLAERVERVLGDLKALKLPSGEGNGVGRDA